MKKAFLTFFVLILATFMLQAAQGEDNAAYNEQNLPIGAPPADEKVNASVHTFPSASSTIIGSLGFIDGTDEVGYFWSVGRGDSVTETFSGPGSITSYKLNVDVVTNVLHPGNQVNWKVTINGVEVDAFRVGDGFEGTISRSSSFRSINGPSYTVKMAVTNEVPGGAGSHTFRYAGVGSNDLELIGGGGLWQPAYKRLFENSDDLEVFRAYRDEVLSTTAKGRKNTDLLYKNSEEALAVLLDNPELMAQAKALIDANKDAVWDVTNGYKGIIYNTEEIIDFLDAYAKAAPPKLRFLAKMVKRQMLKKRRNNQLFFGFKLK
jgi:hypothetical protein